MPREMKLTSREAFEHTLASEELNEEEIGSLLDLKEDQFLDFKSGKLSENERSFKKTIRQWVSGFANAEGGLLVVGPEDDDRHNISPIKRPKDKTLEEWLGSVLSGLPFLYPFPRIVALDHKGDEILLIATMRTADLVPYVEGTVWKFYFRLGHETKQVPTFLVEDLKLGRRAHPALELYNDTAAKNPSQQENYCKVGFRFRVENLGLTTAGDVVVGMVAWNAQGHSRDIVGSPEIAPNVHLKSYFNSENPSFTDWLRR